MYPNAAEEVYGETLSMEIARRINLVAPVLSAEALAANLELLAEVEVIFSTWGAPLMDEAFLSHAPKLQVVFYAAGTVRAA